MYDTHCYSSLVLNIFSPLPLDIENLHTENARKNRELRLFTPDKDIASLINYAIMTPLIKKST